MIVVGRSLLDTSSRWAEASALIHQIRQDLAPTEIHEEPRSHPAAGWAIKAA